MTPGGGHPVVYNHTLGGDGTVNTTVEGLPDTSYMVVVFDIEPSGLPETLAAVLPQSVDGVGRGVVGSGQGPAHTSSMLYCSCMNTKCDFVIVFPYRWLYS